MKLATLHKRIAMQAMNPKNPLAETQAKAIGYNINNQFISLHDLVLLRTQPLKAELRDKDGNIKQANIIKEK